jgi:phosphopantothenoylcysteine decarboxylase/phosphopantothenate--cysteine ligase
MKEKKVIVGVTGGIAAYKAAELVRLLVKAGAETKVAMTFSATKFVTPLTFEALSGNKVVGDMWDAGTAAMDHIQWGQEANLIIIAPAMVVAATAKILVCPSMNSQMYRNPVVQDNLKLLKKRGYAVMEPAEGELACRTEGPGRLPEPEEILEEAVALVTEKDLSGLRILVTAGATIEPIDPVRYMTNRSTGKMGYALGRAAMMRGGEVTLVSGPTNLKPPRGVSFVPVKTAEEMKEAVIERFQQCDVIIKAGAVLDYRPAARALHKIKKIEETQSMELVRNPDILGELGSMKGKSRCLLVGFAAETQDLIANATEKLRKKNLDLIIANDVSRKDAGFEADTNAVKVIYRDGRIEELPLMTKAEASERILDRIKQIWEAGS